MRVDIDIQEQVTEYKTGGMLGMFQKTERVTAYVVFSKIELTQQEKDILTRYELWDHIVFQHKQDAATYGPELRASMANWEPLAFSIKALVNQGNQMRFQFSTPVAAQRFANELQNEHLPNIKRYIEASQQISQPQKRSFDV